MLPAAGGIPGTSVHTTFLCRDKPSMKDALRAAGIPCAQSLGSGSADEIRAFAQQILQTRRGATIRRHDRRPRRVRDDRVAAAAEGLIEPGKLLGGVRQALDTSRDRDEAGNRGGAHGARQGPGLAKHQDLDQVAGTPGRRLGEGA